VIDPIKRRDMKKTLAKIDKLAQKYMNKGLSKREARSRAYAEARDNPRKNFKAYKKKPRR